MPVESAFAPYRLAPGELAVEALRRAEAVAAAPLVVGLGDPLATGMAERSLAAISAARAAAPEEACRGADGSPSGDPGPPRGCLSSERHARRIAEEATRAIAAGFSGVCLDRPDASLALGLLGAGFCPECQRAFLRELVREYGEQFQPVDYLALAREAVAQASGAVGFAQLPFGRDFWRFRTGAMSRAVGRYARDIRDAARSAGRAVEVAAQFEAVGPAQLAAARHLDAAVLPVSSPAPHCTGAGAFRVLRAVMGRRPCAVSLPGSLPAASLPSMAAVAASCGIEIAGHGPPGEAGRSLAGIRHFARALAVRGEGDAGATPVAECAVLYSAESDLWTAGRHRVAVEQAVEALAALQIQAPVVTRVADAPATAALVLSGAEALSPAEAHATLRRLDLGGAVLAFGDVVQVDAHGRPLGPALPPGRASGVKVGRGTLAQLPGLVPPVGSELGLLPPSLEPIGRAVSALLGKGRRAASVVSRTPLLVALARSGETLEAHLATLRPEVAQGATLFLGVHLAGGAKRARFQSADGSDERIVMNPSGYSISTVLPAFRGYAVLTVQA